MPLSEAAQCSSGCSGGCVLPIGDLSERRGLWRSDAAGAAQCGSGEAALRFLPILSPSFSLLIFFLLSPPSLLPFLLQSSVILHRVPPPPTLLFLFLSSSAALLLCYVWWIYVVPGCVVKCIAQRVFAAFGCSDLVRACIRGSCI